MRPTSPAPEQKPKKVKASRKTKENKPPRSQRQPASAQVMRKNAEAEEAKRKLKAAVKARRSFERDEVRRFTAHLRRRRIIWLSIAGSFTAILLFVAVGVFTPILALQQVTVEGASRVPADQIITALTPEMNKPLPLVNMDNVHKAVEAQPLVKSYSVVAVPPHSLIIKLVERQPVGALPSSAGYTLVDPAGVVIGDSETLVEGVPLFTVEDDSIDAPGFQAGVDVLAALPAALAGQVQEVIAKTTDDVTLVLVGGARVFWGGPENSDFKHHVLTKLLAINPVGTVSEYDVSSPNTAVVR